MNISLEKIQGINFEALQSLGSGIGNNMSQVYVSFYELLMKVYMWISGYPLDKAQALLDSTERVTVLDWHFWESIYNASDGTISGTGSAAYKAYGTVMSSSLKETVTDAGHLAHTLKNNFNLVMTTAMDGYSWIKGSGKNRKKSRKYRKNKNKITKKGCKKYKKTLKKKNSQNRKKRKNTHKK